MFVFYMIQKNIKNENGIKKMCNKYRNLKIE